MDSFSPIRALENRDITQVVEIFREQFPKVALDMLRADFYIQSLPLAFRKPSQLALVSTLERSSDRIYRWRTIQLS